MRLDAHVFSQKNSTYRQPLSLLYCHEEKISDSSICLGIARQVKHNHRTRQLILLLVCLTLAVMRAPGDDRKDQGGGAEVHCKKP